MKRCAVVIVGTGAALLLGSSPALAATVAASSCYASFTSAEETNALANGPYGSNPGSVLPVKDFTPSTLVNGAVTPAVALVTCV
jgi:hypothetical protein